MKKILLVLFISLIFCGCGHKVKYLNTKKCIEVCEKNGGLEWSCEDCVSDCKCNNGAKFFNVKMQR